MKKLAPETSLLFLDTLGIAEFLLKDQCDRHDHFSVYASQFEGWTTNCRSRSVELLPLDDSVITCYLDETCLSLQCCREADFISKSFFVRVEIDPCNYLVTLQIEKLIINTTLNDYEWGRWTNMDLYGVIRFRLRLYDLYADQQYSISLILSICWDPSRCEDHNIFKNAVLPKPKCDWNTNFKVKDFSLQHYMKDKGLKTLTELEKSTVLEILGISIYLKSKECKQIYTVQQRHDGLINNCSSEVRFLDDISSFAECRIPEKCTAIDCCLTLPYIGRNINFVIDLDFCSFRLMVEVEKIALNFSLLDYEWGKLQSLSLYGVFNVNFTIEDLSSENVAVFSVNISVCFELFEQCEFSLMLLKEARLAKPSCDLDKSFTVKDFSLRSYLADIGLNGSTLPLPQHTVSELLHYLDIAQFLFQDQCNQHELPFSPNKNGWNKGCPKQLSLPPLDNTTRCHLYDFCTGVACCTDIKILGRSLTTYIKLDPCNRKLYVGIEKMNVTVNLLDYQFGKPEHIKLNGLVHLDFIIEDFKVSRQYMVTFNLSVCFETQYLCAIHVPVLRNTQLPKQICNWKSDFIDTDFSYRSYLQEKGIPEDQTLSSYQMKDLMEELGISEFRQRDECSKSQESFSSLLNGWKNECKRPMTKLPLNPEFVTCKIGQDCTSIECCLLAEKLGTSFKIFVEIEPCLFQLRLGIEQMTFSTLLFDFEWGQPVEAWLFGLVRMQFTLTDLTAEHQYLFDLSVSVCLESAKSEPCYVVVNILDKYRLPKPKCDWNTKISIENFSYEGWLRKGMVKPMRTLAPYLTSKLLSDLNVAAYLNSITCDLNTQLHNKENRGWTKA
ncbi:uncharacterized protein [Mytilus edulis]|uniref:uncharacterized protein n=1 Tax=Mytilus edulis TaxID=6550 RepID=UPI0039EEAE4A